MIESKDLYINQYLSVLFLLKLLACLHLFLTSYTCNDLGDIAKFSENKKNVEGLLDFKFHRSLEEQEFQEQNCYLNMNDKLLDEVDYNNEEYGIYYVSPYEQIRKRTSNNMGVLKRNYKNRFGKKSGLAKWDQYFEKKVFHKLDDIYEISKKKIKNDKKKLKKGIYNKYINRFTLLYFSSLLGLIIPILYSFGMFHIYTYLCDEIPNDKHKLCKLFYENIAYVNSIILSIFYIIFILVFIYGVIKIIKYERIKAIKGKMGLKEYCKFCKGIIRKT
ncbi:Protein of unknown function, putative [Plasmodium vivax]|nr:Protein of unknown function, putative [Plasmodium vivax]